MNNGTVAFDSDALTAMKDESTGEVNINLNTLPREQLSDLNGEMTPSQEKKLAEIENDADQTLISAIDLDVTNKDGEEIHEFGDGYVTISIDFDPTMYNITDLRLQYIRENGVIEYYTPTYSDGKLIVKVPHLSTYLLTYDVNLADPNYVPPVEDDEIEDDTAAPEEQFNFFDRFGTMFMIYSQQYTVTAEAGIGGSISNEGTTTAMYIENVTYTITPDPGYEIESVYIDGVDIGAVSKYTFNFADAPQSISVTFRELPWQNPFKDVYETDVYYDAVAYVTENGIMDGFTRNTFKPKASMKRAEFITSLGKLAGVDTSAYVGYDFAGYTDIDPDSEYAPYAAWAIENGITLGYGDGRFGTDDKITRVQALTMAARYTALLGLPVDSLNTDTVFSWAVNAGLFPADVQIDINSNATRTDIAVMIHAISSFTDSAD